MRKLALSDEILLKIEKPARHGNEVNLVNKDISKVDCVVCHVLPGRDVLK